MASACCGSFAAGPDFGSIFWSAGAFIVIMGVALTALVVVARRRERIIEALAEPIQGLHNRSEYDDITSRILRRARDLGVSALVAARLVRRDDDETKN